MSAVAIKTEGPTANPHGFSASRPLRGNLPGVVRPPGRAKGPPRTEGLLLGLVRPLRRGNSDRRIATHTHTPFNDIVTTRPVNTLLTATGSSEKIHLHWKN